MNLKVEYVDLNEIAPYGMNSKLHPAEQIEQIKKSIEQFGFRDPVGVWNGEIVEGHGRFIAAKELGLATIPIIRLDDLTDEQRRAYALVHNKLTMNSGFDFDLLQLELDSLELDMEQFGFKLEDIPDPLPKSNDGDETGGFNYTEQYGVIVVCDGEKEQEAVYNKLTGEGYNCRVVAV